MTVETVNALRRIRARIEDPARWTQRATARDADPWGCTRGIASGVDAEAAERIVNALNAVTRVLAVLDSAEDAGEHHVRTSDIRRAVNG